MNPADFHSLADRLVRESGTGGLSPAACRTAVSRAYYAAYNVSVALLDHVGFATTNVGACHTHVQHALMNSGIEILVKVGSNLATLYAERRRADYEMKSPIAESVVFATAIVKLAGEMIGTLVAFQNSPPDSKGQLATNVLKYVTDTKPAGLVRK